MFRYLPLIVVLFVANGPSTLGDEYFFENIVPIFQRRCIGCHSDADPKGELSLESRVSAMESGFIEPGEVNSRLLEVISPLDGKAEMPKNADPMTESEIAAIRKWILDGAKWPTGVGISATAIEDFDWWSLKPISKPPLPESAYGTSDHPIDRFIYARLAEKNLKPSPEADRRTLIRRLYFDLLGLPPTPTQIQAFVDDSSPHAYKYLVDKLLTSKHYGERWARHWLDVVHYADTHGYDKDKLRPNAWPYRDYVIRAFNEDKPYWRFVQEQIAGDVLWPDTEDGITATGFIAAGPWDFIGHAEVPETKIDGRIARHLDRDDMVSSTLNTFASTTIQCARCHHHKFDPISQEHYYSLQAVFAALDRADRLYDKDPEVAARRAKLLLREKELKRAIEKLEEEITDLGGPQLKSLDDRIRELEKQTNKSSDARPEFGYHSSFSEQQNTEKWFQIDLGQIRDISKIEFVAAHDNFGGIGAGFGFPLRYKIECSNDSDFKVDVTTLWDQTNKDVRNPGIQIQSQAVKVASRYVRMTATKLFHRKDTYIFALGEFRAFSGNEVISIGRQVTALDSIEAPPRWKRANVVDGHFYGERIAVIEIKEQLRSAKEKRIILLKERIPDSIRKRHESKKQALEENLAAQGQLPPQNRVYAGTVHTGKGAFKGTGANGGKPRTIHVLHRGDILQPRGTASPGRIPLSNDDSWHFALEPDHNEADRRVALAQWLTQKNNPLVWRSIVNRIWQYHFGKGLVDTPNDFGRMGAIPTHPELLDWLATEFRDGGNSIKALHRLIVTSATYRQTSQHQAENALIDRDNRFLWRMNRRRLTAEEIRDAVLEVSGKINKQLYGPGMRLFVLERAEHSPHYEYYKHDPEDPKSHRRSIYRFVVRSQPDPFMTTLDCADSSQSVPKRIETVTALQALSLLNNKFMLAMAQHFADRVSDAESTVTDQVQLAFHLALGHKPSHAQLKPLVSYARQHGLANTCRLLFNLNEFVFVD